MTQKTVATLAREVGVNHRQFYRLLKKRKQGVLRAMRGELAWRHKDLIEHTIDSMRKLIGPLRRTDPEIASQVEALAKTLGLHLSGARKHSKRPDTDWVEQSLEELLADAIANIGGNKMDPRDFDGL